MKIRWWFLGCLLLIIINYQVAAVVEQRIVSYGKDLTTAEREQIIKEMPFPTGVTAEQVKSIEVTNEEEWQLFRGIVADEAIGTKAISSVYIEKLAEGAGIKVETRNLSLITPLMFGNALVTAGIKDATIYATAPNLVSGTAALTGIYKSFESLTGEELATESKQVAARELVQTADLGEEVGKERAALLVERSKERVIAENAVDQQQVLRIITSTAKEQNVPLTEEQKTELAKILLEIKGLNLNLEQLRTQLQNFQPPTEKEDVTEEKDGSWINQLLEFIGSLIDRLFSSVGKLFNFNNRN